MECLTLLDRLEKDNTLDAAGGEATILAVMHEAFTDANIVKHVEMLRELREFEDRKGGTLTEQVREWILATYGTFLTTDVHKELQLTTVNDKKTCRFHVMRVLLRPAGLRDGNLRGDDEIPAAFRALQAILTAVALMGEEHDTHTVVDGVVIVTLLLFFLNLDFYRAVYVLSEFKTHLKYNQ